MIEAGRRGVTADTAAALLWEGYDLSGEELSDVMFVAYGPWVRAPDDDRPGLLAWAYDDEIIFRENGREPKSR
jgi:hypothetical protein